MSLNYFANVATRILSTTAPVVQFNKTVYFVAEDEQAVGIPIIRDGDITEPSTVTCFTKQLTAVASQDFKVREDNEESVIHFKAGMGKYLLYKQVQYGI